MADLLLIDYVGTWESRRKSLVEACLHTGGMVLVYPHGGRATYQYDQLVDPHPGVTAHLVQGPAHVTTYAMIGLKEQVVTIGWYYCPLREFAPVEKMRRILFCPAHPFGGDGVLSEREKQANASVFRTLLGQNAELHVTMFGSHDQNGLWPAQGVFFNESDLKLSWADIDRADLVVAEGTKAYLAVARGKATIMTGQDIAPLDDSYDRSVPRWDLYGQQSRYPLDFVEDGFEEVARIACAGSPEVEQWRDGFIGQAFDADLFVTLVNGLWQAHLAKRGSLSAVTCTPIIPRSPPSGSARPRVRGAAP